MTTDHTGDELERRLSRSLHQAAPRASTDLPDRLLSRTAVVQQRRGLAALRFAPMLAGAAVVTGALVLGLFLGGLLPRNDNVGPAPTPTAVPSITAPAASEEPSATPLPSASPSPTPADDVIACTNADLGYTVSYPADWWANERVEPDFEGGNAVAACTVFAEEPFDVRPNSELPPGLAISIGVSEVMYPPSSAADVLSEDEVTVAGRPAVVREDEETSTDGPFMYAGQRRYTYFVELPDGRYLVATVSSQQDQADAVYEEHKRVLDAMLESLQLSEG